MKATKAQIKAARHCLDQRMPFALWSLPGETDAIFCCAQPEDGISQWPPLKPGQKASEDDWLGFYINYFANEEEYIVGIRAQYDEFNYPKDIRFDDEPDIEPSAKSTDKYAYLGLATQLIDSLEDDTEKVVLSRLIALEGSDDVVGLALEYFKKYPSTFRYICYTRETGIWFGASPEIVARYNTDSGRIVSQAIAGTRPASVTGDWDKKNLKEHALVPMSIISSLSEFGGKVDVEQLKMSEIQFGDIVHLCTTISSTLDNVPAQDVLTEISPTAAIAGWPRHDAINRIFVFETHSRHYYGGFVGVKIGPHIYAYANIRCAFVGSLIEPSEPSQPKKRLYNIYAGGGLINKSKPADEWVETENKSRHLVDLVKNYEKV
ncbi:MAG: chorismate-binding protein [Muribaculaceae bacterium]|nr:chorismate-binding protein [Muribaculaceae bacterium]